LTSDEDRKLPSGYVVEATYSRNNTITLAVFKISGGNAQNLSSSRKFYVILRTIRDQSFSDYQKHVESYIRHLRRIWYDDVMSVTDSTPNFDDTSKNGDHDDFAAL
jgi:hypothetical protein